MDHIAERALNQAQVAGATYADERVISQRSEVISVKNGKVEAFDRSTSDGFGARCRATRSQGQGDRERQRKASRRHDWRQ